MIILGKCVDIMVKTEYNNHRITKHYVFLEERRCDGALSFFLKLKKHQPGFYFRQQKM